MIVAWKLAALAGATVRDERAGQVGRGRGGRIDCQPADDCCVAFQFAGAGHVRQPLQRLPVVPADDDVVVVGWKIGGQGDSVRRDDRLACLPLAGDVLPVAGRRTVGPCATCFASARSWSGSGRRIS